MAKRIIVKVPDPILAKSVEKWISSTKDFGLFWTI